MVRKTSKERFLERDDISKTNKDHVKKFFKSYNCAHTTAEKFYSELPYILTRCDDLKATMLDNGKLADIFDRLHNKLSPSTYKIVVDCTRSLSRFLNDGELPKSFEFIKKLTKHEKKKLARVNKSDYKTLSWEDALNMAEQTNSIQIKALVLSQIDGGFRPAELENLNYKDVKKDGKFIVCSVRESKTAEPREVLLYKAAPYLNRWLQMHPTKKGSDPLWIMEHQTMSSSYRAGNKQLRYTYDAIRQKITRLSKKAGLGAVSLYMMRHSAVALTKEERMGCELAAEKFGHDINYYVNVYGKLTPEQKRNRFKAHYGEGKQEDKDKPKPQLCPVCDTINEPGLTHCEKCNSPLSLAVALQEEKNKDSEIEDLKKKVDNIPELISQAVADILSKGADVNKLREKIK